MLKGVHDIHLLFQQLDDSTEVNGIDPVEDSKSEELIASSEAAEVFT